MGDGSMIRFAWVLAVGGLAGVLASARGVGQAVEPPGTVAQPPQNAVEPPKPVAQDAEEVGRATQEGGQGSEDGHQLDRDAARAGPGGRVPHGLARVGQGRPTGRETPAQGPHHQPVLPRHLRSDPAGISSA